MTPTLPVGFRRTILCDLDDTLVVTSPLYTRAIDSLIELLHAVLPEGVPAEAIREAQESVDGHLTGSAFDPERFPRSFMETYRHFCGAAGCLPDPSIERRCLELGRRVYEDTPPLSPHVDEFLSALAPRADLWLYTLGVEHIQRPKIDSHGLSRYFDAVHIVPDKSVDTLRALIANRAPNTCAIVGDSLRFEINPGIALGIFAVHIRHDVTWKFAQSPPLSGAYHAAEDLRAAGRILDAEFFSDASGGNAVKRAAAPGVSSPSS